MKGRNIRTLCAVLTALALLVSMVPAALADHAKDMGQSAGHTIGDHMVLFAVTFVEDETDETAETEEDEEAEEDSEADEETGIDAGEGDEAGDEDKKAEEEDEAGDEGEGIGEEDEDAGDEGEGIGEEDEDAGDEGNEADEEDGVDGEADEGDPNSEIDDEDADDDAGEADDDDGKPEEDEAAVIERAIHVFTDAPSVVHKGQIINLYSELTGYEGCTLAYQWQYSADGNTWSDAAGATGAAYAFAATRDLINCVWRLAVTVLIEA